MTAQVECIVFRKKASYEFLLLRRIPKKGGFWQPVCGGMEDADASILDACYRELFEEAKISKKDIIRVINEFYTFEISKHYLSGKIIPHVKEHVYGFEIAPQTSISIENNACIEHDKFVWVSFDKAIKLLKWDNNKEALSALWVLLNKI